MSLNHTIRLYNYDYKTAIDKLAAEYYEPVVILTKINKPYFGEEGITVGTMKEFGSEMLKIMNHYTGFYCATTTNYIVDVVQGFKEAGLNVRNILSIPVTNDYAKGFCIRNRTSYDENKTFYVVYSTKGCHGRNLNYTKIVNTEGSCEYSAIWNWFKGSEIDAYKTIIRLSSDHRDEVFDPFMNNGDTGVAAIETDRHYTGVEEDGAKYRAIHTRLDCHGE